MHGHSYQTANFHSSPARSTENARGSSALLPLFDFKVHQRLHDDDLSLLYHSQRFHTYRFLGKFRNSTIYPFNSIIYTCAIFRVPVKKVSHLSHFEACSCSGLPWIFIVKLGQYGTSTRGEASTRGFTMCQSVQLRLRCSKLYTEGLKFKVCII